MSNMKTESELDKYWEELQIDIVNILKDGVSEVGFTQLTKNAYEMVLNKRGEKLYYGIEELVYNHLTDVILPSIIGATSNDAFLSNLVSRWNHHKYSMQLISSVAMHLDRIYIAEAQSDLEPTNKLGIQLFRDHIVDAPIINDRLNETMLDLIKDDPKNDAFDWASLKFLREMLIELDFGSSTYYKNKFKIPFLQKLFEYYVLLSEKILAENNANTFMNAVEKYINQQNEFNECFDSMTSYKIELYIKQHFIIPNANKYIERIIINLPLMIKNDSIEDLISLYNRLKLISMDTRVMADAMIKFMNDQSEALAECTDPIVYIKTFLKDQFYYFFNSDFSDTKFKNAITPEFVHFLNRNPRSPEFLSIFLDKKLRKNLNIDTDIDKAIMLYKYLEEKDVFEKYYQIHLAKRLLLGSYKFEESEKYIISKLKTNYAVNYASKLEGMLKDFEVSKAFMNLYKQKYSGSEVEISVKILNKAYWPIAKANVCNIPISVEKAFNNFKNFYIEKYKGRVVYLNSCMGTAEIKATLYKKIDGSNQFREETKIFIVSTYQMCILMAFNDRDSYTYNELMEYTKISDRDLKKALMSLCKPDQCILKLEGASLEAEIKADNIFSVNDNFSSKLARIYIKQVSNKCSESDSERKEALRKVEDDRKCEIEAAIVRIMKLNQKLNHNELVTESIKQMNHRFNPDLSMIKMRIESLIEREYLKRDEIDSRYYCYVA